MTTYFNNRNIISAISIFMVIFSIILLVGNFLNIDALINPFGIGITPKFNTMLCFMFFGIAIHSLNRFENITNKIISYTSSIIILFISMMTLSQYIFHYDIGFDQIFVEDMSHMSEGYNSGRMIPLTAYLFMLDAIAIILLMSNSGKFHRYANLIAYTALVFASISTLRYFFIIDVLNTRPAIASHFIEYFINMALVTSILFMLLNLSLLLKYPEDNVMKYIYDDSFIGGLFRKITVFILAAPILAALIVQYGQYVNYYDSNISIAILVVMIIFTALIVATGSAGYLRHEFKLRNIAYDKLKLNEALFREFTENIDSVFWRSTESMEKFEYISSAYEKIFGKEIIVNQDYQKYFLDSIVSEDKSRYINEYIEKIKRKDVKHAEIQYRIRDLDNKIRYIYDKAFKIQDESSNSIIGIASDITIQLRMQNQVSALNSITTLMSMSNDIGKICREVLSKICKAFEFDLGEIWLVDVKNDVLRCVDIWYPPELDLNEFLLKGKSITLKRGIGMPGKVWEAGNLVWIADITKDNKLTRAKEAAKAGIKSVVGVPLTCRGVVYGTMDFSSRFSIRHDENAEKILLSLGEQLGIYISNNLTAYQLEEMVNFDTLTGLYSVTTLTNIVNNRIINNKEDEFTVFMIDTSKSKLVNEIMGYDAGILLTKEISEKISSISKMSARVGEDVFVFILPINKKDEIINVINKLFLSFKHPVKINDVNVYISINIGVTRYPHDGGDFQSLLMNAEAALYIAKRKGSDNYNFHSESIKTQLIKEFTYRNQFKSAIINNEFKLYYQPIYDLRINKVTSLEALLRWLHPQYGILTPDMFLNIAEEDNNIKDIGEWVIKEVSRFIKVKELKYPVSLNLSIKQFDDNYDLLAYIESISKQYGFSGGKIRYEITESLMIDNINRVKYTLNILRSRGSLILLDDFGTGYSSFNYLKQFIPDILKIDKSFIHDMLDDNNSQNIVKSMISVAHNIGAKVIAEGVENESQVKFLIRNNCDYIQGYYISAPLPENEIIQLLSRKDLIY